MTNPQDADTRAPNPQDSTPDNTWSVSYWDQSSNGYRFWQAEDGEARFVYDPVTPSESSSGTYSGGRPNEGSLDPNQIEALFVRLCGLEANTAAHTSKRQMGTGMFHIREGDSQRRFILRNGSDRRAFDAFVAQFRKP